MTAYPLMLTVELEEGERADGDIAPDRVVIKLNGHVVRKIPLNRHVYPGDREALEQYAADWLAGPGQGESTA
jgi:hypothetical protein